MCQVTSTTRASSSVGFGVTRTSQRAGDPSRDSTSKAGALLSFAAMGRSCHATAVWFLVGTGGMGCWDYCRGL